MTFSESNKKGFQKYRSFKIICQNSGHFLLNTGKTGNKGRVRGPIYQTKTQCVIAWDPVHFSSKYNSEINQIFICLTD